MKAGTLFAVLGGLALAAVGTIMYRRRRAAEQPKPRVSDLVAKIGAVGEAKSARTVARDVQKTRAEITPAQATRFAALANRGGRLGPPLATPPVPGPTTSAPIDDEDDDFDDDDDDEEDEEEEDDEDEGDMSRRDKRQQRKADNRARRQDRRRNKR